MTARALTSVGRSMTPRSGRAWLFWIAVVVTCTIVFAMSQHGLTGHASQLYSSRDVAEILYNTAWRNGDGSRVCTHVLVATCPLATVHDPLSPNYGQVSPQIIVWCDVNGEHGAKGVFGIKNFPTVVYLTGYPQSYEQFMKNVARDNCIVGDWTVFFNVVKAAMGGPGAFQH